MNSIVGVACRKYTASGVEELKQLEKERGAELGRTIKQAIEQAEARVEWSAQNYNTIVNWLKNNNDH